MKQGIYRIICPHCKKETLENTELFNPDIKPNGKMFRQIDGVKVRSRHDALPSVKGQNFQCPMCFMPVCTPGGNVKLRDCETGEVCLSNAVLIREDPPPAEKIVAPKKKAKKAKKA